MSRERWAAIPVRSPVWKGRLFTTGQPWWLQTPFLSHHSPEPTPERGVPHKLRGKTKLGVGFGAQLLLHRQKGCAQNMAQSLSDQKLEMCLCFLNSSFSEPPRDLWICLNMKAGSWKPAQTHRSAIPQGKAPLLISVSLKATQENSETLVPPLYSLQIQVLQLLLPQSEVIYTKPPSTLLPGVVLSVLMMGRST